MGVSFQMSFAAVLALIAGYDALRPVLSRLHGGGWRRMALHGAAPVVTSLLAGTASAPYAAYHFGHVQLYFIVANVVAVPLTALWVLPWGVVALLLMPFGAEQLAFTPMGWGLEAILWVARGVSSWPAATVSVPPMPAWGLAVFSLGLAWLCLWRTPVRLAGVAVMLVGLLSPLMAARAGRAGFVGRQAGGVARAGRVGVGGAAGGVVVRSGCLADASGGGCVAAVGGWVRRGGVPGGWGAAGAGEGAGAELRGCSDRDFGGAGAGRLPGCGAGGPVHGVAGRGGGGVAGRCGADGADGSGGAGRAAVGAGAAGAGAAGDHIADGAVDAVAGDRARDG